VGVVSVGFGLGLLKLLIYHFELTYSRLTTNEDLKETYQVVKGSVPFPRCQPQHHPPLFDRKSRLIRSDDVEMSFEERRQSVWSQSKGIRYSTLVSGRDSVLNSLVDAPL
jgi:hypothetical protein